jgi:uncharacterized damage-inducible protein DinB
MKPTLAANELALAEMFRKDACSNLYKHLPRIVRCLELLSEKDIWWRPNAASNSAGNIVLHLCGNVRQWIISGLGRALDVRDRDSEFAERGPIPRRVLVTRLKETVKEARKTIEGITPEALLREFFIQGYRASGLVAIAHVSEHFSYHTGQIIYLTKLRRGKDLRFTRLPATKVVRKRAATARP